MVPKSKRNVVLSIEGAPGFISLFAKNVATNKVENQCRLSCTYSQLFNKLASTFNLKDVIACIFRTVEFEIMSYKEAYEFRLQCREFCERNDLFFCFADNFQLCALTAVTNAKAMVDVGEEVLAVLSMPPAVLGIIKMIREKDSYRIYHSDDSLTPDNFKGLPKTYHPKKVVILHLTFFNNSMDAVNKSFKQYNPVIMSQGFDQKLSNEMAVDKVLHLMGEKINPYHVAALCTTNYRVLLGNTVIMTASYYDTLPFEQFEIIDVDPAKTVSLHVDISGPHNPLKQFKLSSFKSKQVKVTLTFDINSFYDLKVEPFVDDLDPAVSKLHICDKIEKVQMVFDKQNFTVVVYANDNKEYVLEDSDGLDKTPIYISFIETKPVIGNVAKEVYEKQPNHVVFDLIKLCSITSADVMNPKWGFSLSKEADSIYVAMQTSEGEKQSTVEFLLALVLKNAIKRVRKETGEKVSEIEIGFDGVLPNETLKKNFVDAGKLMKCSIVFV